MRLCVLVRSTENGRVNAEAADRPYTDCRGNTVTPSAGDNTVRRRFERVFAIRNNLSIPL